MSWFWQGVQSYAYIILFLFVPGAIIQASFISFGPSVLRRLSIKLEALLINSFILSIAANVLLAYLLEVLGWGLADTKSVLFVLSFLLALFIAFKIRGQQIGVLLKSIECYLSWEAFAFISAMFVIMVFQGGLLDFMADGWWHMSYANRMVQDDSMFIHNHFLVGWPTDAYEVMYPPFWHLQLALINEASDIPIPVIWHFVASVNVTLLLIAYYLLVKVLGGGRVVAFLSIVLHCFLIGGLVTYFRVASWPGNVAYILLFYAFYLTFHILNRVAVASYKETYVEKLKDLPLGDMIVLSITCILITGLHGVELVLFILGIGAYLLSITVIDMIQSSQQYMNDRKVLGYILLIGVVLSFLAAISLFSGHLERVFSMQRAQEPYLNFIVPSLILGYIALGVLICRQSKTGISRRKTLGIYLLGGIVLLGFVIDFEQIKLLFVFEVDIEGVHVPRDFYDRFDNRVYLPFWIHQLRGGMLFSGLISILVGLVLLYRNESKISVFVGANALLVLFTLTSPYIFTFVSFMIPLHSVYRVHMLLFSPIIIAVFINNMLKSKELSGSANSVC